MCNVTDLTADAEMHGDVIEIDGKLCAVKYREPVVTNVFCAGCGGDLDSLEAALEHVQDKGVAA